MVQSAPWKTACGETCTTFSAPATPWTVGRSLGDSNGASHTPLRSSVVFPGDKRLTAKNFTKKNFAFIFFKSFVTMGDCYTLLHDLRAESLGIQALAYSSGTRSNTCRPRVGVSMRFSRFSQTRLLSPLSSTACPGRWEKKRIFKKNSNQSDKQQLGILSPAKKTNY